MVAEKDCYFAVLTLKMFRRIIKVIELFKQQQRINFLKSIPFLNELFTETLQKFDNMKEIKKFKKGNIVFKEGQIDKNVYLITKGEFVLQKKITL